MKTFRSLCVLAALALLAGPVFAQARYSIIHNFAGGANDGSGAPAYGSLTLSGTTFFGMTTGGGSGMGTVFKINTNGTGFAVLHSFAGGAADGANPFGSVTLSGSTLYGMTNGGGSAGLGTVFRLNTDGTSFTVLHSFMGGVADGANPYGSLTLSGSTLYGMTYAGGSASQGTIFMMNTDGTNFAVVHSFDGSFTGSDKIGGSHPHGSLTLVGTVLYGMATAESYSSWDTVVFQLNTDGTGFAKVGDMGNFTVGGAADSLAVAGSTLYGMNVPYEGIGTSVFRINTDGTGAGSLHTFVYGTSGVGTPIVDGSILYGSASSGTDTTVFQVNTDGTGFTVLYYFPSDGLAGSLTLVGTSLYGYAGNSIFSLNPNAPWITTQPSGQTVLVGVNVTFSVALTGGSPPFTYQWQRQAAGSATWTNLTDSTTYGGTTTPTLTVNYATTAMNGDSFRCVSNNSAGSDTSSAAVLAVPQPRTVASQTVTTGANATFAVTGGGPSPVAHQWQRIPAGSSIWTNLSDSTTYSGTSTATLTVNSVTAAMNGDLFRCVSSNSYGSDTSSTAVLVVPTPLTVSTVAGQGGHSGGSDGSGSTAQFYGPTDVATDSAGNVYVADTDNHTIRKMTSAGVVSTVAGYTGTSGSADGAATVARFNHPSGVTTDGAGNVYVADTDNNTVRKITSAGMVSTVAGTAGMSGSVDDVGTAARFNKPSGIVVDTAGNLYVADTLNHTIRKITPSALVSTLAGAAGTSGSVDDVGSAARFYGPQGLALSSAGTLYVADANNSTIRKITVSTGSVVTWAGLAGATGSADGPGYMARFYYPSGVTIDNAGNLYVADTDNHAIRVITLLGEVTTIAGKVGTSGSTDGVGDAARFNHPTGIAVDSSGNLYVADADNDTIRLGIYPAAPTITTQPQSQTVTAGNNVQFTVTASGKPAPTYQWNFNGTAISGATGSSLSLTIVQAASAGDYTVTVSNSSGSVTSNKATLTVNAASTGNFSSGGGGGGGAMEPWFAAALLLLQIARWAGQRKPNVQVASTSGGGPM